MADQLSAQDWVDQGLRTLARDGFTALKADPLAKVMGVSRGSFYWHFADIAAYHAAVLARWREVALDNIIADMEQAPPQDTPLRRLLRRVFAAKPALEVAVRSWAAHDAAARRAVQAVDRRRLGYVADLLIAAGVPAAAAQTRAQILYWAFLGFALSEKAAPGEPPAALIDELVRMAGVRG
jgi:AcrR family transcriptional regulator